MNVKTLCLSILNFGDATGYEIKKMSEDGRFSHFIDASFGSIYPALVRLTEDGYVSCREEHQAGKPDRKVYSLTDAGRAAFQRALREDPAPDKFKSEFLLQMMCAGMLDTAYVERLIDTRIAHLQEELNCLKEAQQRCDHQGSQYVIGYGLAVFRAALSYLETSRERGIALAGTETAAKDAAE